MIDRDGLWDLQQVVCQWVQQPVDIATVVAAEAAGAELARACGAAMVEALLS